MCNELTTSHNMFTFSHVQHSMCSLQSTLLTNLGQKSRHFVEEWKLSTYISALHDTRFYSENEITDLLMLYLAKWNKKLNGNTELLLTKMPKQNCYIDCIMVC